MSAGCPYGAGPACADCNGWCWEPQDQEPPAYTIEDECDGRGHPYYGDHEGMGRCYCGAQRHALGGGSAAASAPVGGRSQDEQERTHEVAVVFDEEHETR